MKNKIIYAIVTFGVLLLFLGAMSLGNENLIPSIIFLAGGGSLIWWFVVANEFFG